MLVQEHLHMFVRPFEEDNLFYEHDDEYLSDLPLLGRWQSRMQCTLVVYETHWNMLWIIFKGLATIRRNDGGDS